MLALLAAAAIAWHSEPVDTAWAHLAADFAAHDAVAFSADRSAIASMSSDLLVRWSATPHESFATDSGQIVTFDGPTRVRGERARTAYFAVVTPADEFSPPTIWEATPGFSPGVRTVWNLSVSSCDLASGHPLTGYPHEWRTFGIDSPPAYADFKAEVLAVLHAHGEFSKNTYTANTPGTMCLYVGALSTEHLRADPRPRAP